MCEFCGLDGACAVCGVKHPTGEVLAVCRRYEWFRSHGVAQCAAVDYARAESWFDSVEWRYSGDPSWGASYPPGTVHHWHRIQWHKGTPILMRWDNLQQVWRGVGSSELVAAPHTPMGRILAAQLVSEVLKA